MARTLSLSFTSSYNQLHNINHTNHFKSQKTSLLSQNQTNPFVNFTKSRHYNLILTSTSQQSSSYSTSSSPTLLIPLQTNTFLSNEDLEKLQSLQNFSYFQELESGSMWVRVMRDDELDMTVELLAESFVESMVMPKGYVKLLGILVKQYLVERRSLMPHTATLIGFYKGNDDEEGEGELAGTVEISFSKKGASTSPPSPTPPKDSPYICNMTVKKSLRRRGIGWHLLKASEELIFQMSSSRDIYLHCRMIDVAPFNMYTRAGYSVLETDNIFILLTLQRRKHLMCKHITVSTTSSEMDVSEPSEDYCL